jgi:hypothetical protein
MSAWLAAVLLVWGVLLGVAGTLVVQDFVNPRPGRHRA